MQMIRPTPRKCMAAALFVLAMAQPLAPARAELVLSQLIVELKADGKMRDDIEVWNNSPERAYVAVDPNEIINPGQASEERRREPDPEKRGLLVAPARLILEPGQRKLVRVAALAAGVERERVYRVTVKPVAGELSAERSGLKILVGYDVLVLLRPANAHPQLTARRSGNSLTFRNDGNASLELADGRQCAPDGKCARLPGKRLYAGAQWSEPLSSAQPVEYRVICEGRSDRRIF
jgi:P pilus assembly chaperone PapD